MVAPFLLLILAKIFMIFASSGSYILFFGIPQTAALLLAIRKLFLVTLMLMFAPAAFGYPEFIGYRYPTCLTCHFNGHGSGALTDYGRALYATELAGRLGVSQRTTEDELSERSGFFGKTEMPWWMRPALKYRGLWFQNNPGSGSSQSEKFYQMQTDLNLTLFADRDQKWAFITTAAYSETGRPFATFREEEAPGWFLKEAYVRTQAQDDLWIYAGLMDKVYGLRRADHTAVSRTRLGVGAFDQSAGFVLHRLTEQNEWAVNLFSGHPSEPSEFRQKGISLMGERSMGSDLRWGGSAMWSESDVITWKRLALHTRQGIDHGSALMTEVGIFENRPRVSAGSPIPLGAYAIFEALARWDRGAHLLSILQWNKLDLSRKSGERASVAVGALLFPIQRTEFRMMLIHQRVEESNRAAADAWQAQTQLHLSL